MKGLKFSWIYDDAINVECVSDNIQTQGRRKLFCGGGLNKNVSHPAWSTKKNF